MPKKLAVEVDHEVRKLSGEGFSKVDIVKRLKGTKNEISLRTVNNILNFVGNRRNHKSVGLSSPKVEHRKHPRPSRHKQNVAKVNRWTDKENPPSQRKMARHLKVSLSTVSNIIHLDLKKK